MSDSDEEGDERDDCHDKRRDLSEETYKKGNTHDYFHNRENLYVVRRRTEAQRFEEAGDAPVLASKLAAPEHDDEDGKGNSQERRGEEAKG